MALVSLSLLVLATAACGTRLSHDRLVADARNENGQTADSSSSGRGFVLDASVASDGTTATTIGSSGSVGGGSQTTPGAQSADASGGTTGPAARSCTGNESHLIIASVGQLSGPAGNGVLDEVKATQAWVAMTNAKGGVNCHPVDYLVADDGGDPARQQALTQQMVEQNHVVAFVTPVAALTGRASVAYLTSHRIPSIGGVMGDWAYQSSMFFPSGAGAPDQPLPRTGVDATAEWAHLHGKTKLAVVTCSESSDCATVNTTYGQYSASAGMELVYNGQASALQPDYTSVCQAAQRAGAELFAPVLGPAGLTRLAQSCLRVNYKPLYIVPQVTAQPPMASDSNLTPLGVTMPVIPWTETGNPAIAEMHDALHRYAPAVQPGPASVIGWVSAKLFEAATRNLADTTSEAILEGLWSIQNDDLGGITVPLTFTRDQPPVGASCWWLAEGADGQWTSPNGGQRHCG